MENQDIQTLLHIMGKLRDPDGGCPWDQKQTFASVLPYTIEETYEVADAIEREDFTELKSELGDLLFQIVFYAQMASELGEFDFADVVQGINEKMIRRHPHVFAGEQFEDEQALRKAWEQQKQNERGETEQHGVLDGVARALPALIRADKLQKRAARVGFDWPDVQGALAKSREELLEIEQALSEGDEQAVAEEVGDFLFAAVNVARLLDLDAEQTLRHGNDKFVRRFTAMEDWLAKQGQADLSELSLDELEAGWQAVKREEHA